MEGSLQRTVAQYLTLALPPDAWYTHIVNESPGGRTPQSRRDMRIWREKLVARGMKPGAPDILIIHRGRALCIELKWGQGKVSSAQVECHKDIHAAGARVHLCRNLDDVYEVLVKEGVPVSIKPM